MWKINKLTLRQLNFEISGKTTNLTSIPLKFQIILPRSAMLPFVSLLICVTNNWFKSAICGLSVGASHIHSSRTLPRYSHVWLALQLAKYPLAVSQLATRILPMPWCKQAMTHAAAPADWRCAVASFLRWKETGYVNGKRGTWKLNGIQSCLSFSARSVSNLYYPIISAWV